MADRGDSLGFDLYVGPASDGSTDMSSDGRSSSGVELVRNGMFARCQADTILKIGAPGGVVDFGRDVRSWVGEAMTQADADAKSQELAVVFARDPRLDAGSIIVAITIQLAGAQYAFIISVTARTTTAQPIWLICGVNAITVDDLTQGSSS